MRKLASIQKIKSLDTIPNADAIVKATVLGWQLVVKKGEFHVGDLCVYCEIDSVLPERPEFLFLKPRHMRIKTARLRGQISQGICFPLSILPSGTPIDENTDVTDALGITLYEIPIPASLAGKAKGGFPSFIPKTDETRVQVLQDRLTAFRGTACMITEKLDGSSVTFYFRNGEFGVCSRNLELYDTPDALPWRAAHALRLDEKLRALGKNLALQGELIGTGIQKNKYKLGGTDVFFFNVFDIDSYSYLNAHDALAVMKSLDVKPVPILDDHFLLTDSIDDIVQLSIGKSALNPDAPREGIVIRPLTESRDADGRVSFKAINPEFLLKYDE
jgi:RNA ligase (TIGR02306 family)